jgi:hypothetical protein
LKKFFKIPYLLSHIFITFKKTLMAGIFTPEQIGKRFMFDKEAKKELKN